MGLREGPRREWSTEHPTDLRNPANRLSIIAVQGLGSHEYYTWVKKMSPRGDKARRFWDKARFRKGKKTLDQDQDDGMEVMWIRDLLVPKFQDARIATYSYKSDWRDPTVKTSLRECANLFLNDLLQHRHKENVSILRNPPLEYNSSVTKVSTTTRSVRDL